MKIIQTGSVTSGVVITETCKFLVNTFGEVFIVFSETMVKLKPEQLSIAEMNMIRAAGLKAITDDLDSKE